MTFQVIADCYYYLPMIKKNVTSDMTCLYDQTDFAPGIDNYVNT